MDELIQFITNGNLQRVTEVLDANPERLDMVAGEGRTPLHYAVWKEQPEIVNLLLNRGSQAALMRDAHGSAPIHFAAESGDVQTVDQLVNWIRDHVGPDVVREQMLIRGFNNKLPLHFAVDSGNADTILRICLLEPEAFLLDGPTSFFLSHLPDEIFRLAFQMVPPERLRQWIIISDEGLFVEICVKRSDELYNAVLEIVPLESIPRNILLNTVRKLSSTQYTERARTLLRILSPLSTSDFIELFESAKINGNFQQILYEETNGFAGRSPDELSLVLYHAAISNHESIFFHVYHMGLTQYGWQWIVDTMMGKFGSKIKELLPDLDKCCDAPQIFGQLIDVCFKMATDSFLRGLLYHQIVKRDDGLVNRIIKIDDSVSMVSLAMMLMNAVGGPGVAWTSLHISGWYQSHHLAVGRDHMNIVQFLVGIGCELSDTQEPQPRTCLELAGNRDMGAVISALDGSVPNQEIRYRAYFRISLFYRLIHFI